MCASGGGDLTRFISRTMRDLRIQEAREQRQAGGGGYDPQRYQRRSAWHRRCAELEKKFSVQRRGLSRRDQPERKCSDRWSRHMMFIGDPQSRRTCMRRSCLCDPGFLCSRTGVPGGSERSLQSGGGSQPHFDRWKGSHSAGTFI